MRCLTLIALLAVPVLAQNPPNCRGVGVDIDVRCACVKDPNSKLCEMVKAGFYDTDKRIKPLKLNLGIGIGQFPPRAPSRVAASTRPEAARVVPLPHRDYLRFLQSDAQFAAGFHFEKLFRSPELMEALFGRAESQDARNKVISALKEMDRLWISLTAPDDVVILATGRFEQGAAAGMFYAQGIRPVFLGGAGAMMVGSEPSIQAALARLARPATKAGWVARRARELSQDHETWIVSERPTGTVPPRSAVESIRRFALGFKLAGDVNIEGEAGTDSDADAITIAGWIEGMKVSVREKTGVGVLDSLIVERNGPSVHFRARDNALLNGEAGKSAMSSDLGVDLYSVIMAGFPGVPDRVVASDKLLAVREGMKREEVLSLLGQPLSVTAIHGLDSPRETWKYQVPFGRQVSMRLEGGVVTKLPQ